MIMSAVRLIPAVAPAIASVLFASGNAHAQQAPASHTSTWEESGEASWYGGRHNGRRTSSGRIFNENEMTAAHATLPLGTRVRVTMQETGQSVVVTITDRQPPKYVRVIDLSKGAATRIGLLSRGTAMVTLQPARPDETEEVAEAPAGTGYEGTLDQPAIANAVPRRRGAVRARHAAQVSAHAKTQLSATARHPANAPAVLRVRRSVQHPAAQRRL